jgi:hypothetical protein
MKESDKLQAPVAFHQKLFFRYQLVCECSIKIDAIKNIKYMSKQRRYKNFPALSQILVLYLQLFGKENLSSSSSLSSWILAL